MRGSGHLVPGLHSAQLRSFQSFQSHLNFLLFFSTGQIRTRGQTRTRESADKRVTSLGSSQTSGVGLPPVKESVPDNRRQQARA